jgi:hypothetical protein
MLQHALAFLCGQQFLNVSIQSVRVRVLQRAILGRAQSLAQ